MAQKFMGNKKLFLDTKLISLKIFDQNYYLIDKIFEVKEKFKKKLIFMFALVALKFEIAVH